MVRIAALSDVHGNLPALQEVRRAVDAARPDYVAICGDLAFNGPDPAASSSAPAPSSSAATRIWP
jgi:predicted phosphodiesterase